MKNIFSFLILAVMVTACSGEHRSLMEGAPEEVPSVQSQAPDPVDTVVIVNYPTTAKIQTQGEWQSFWSTHTGSVPTLPSVDFVQEDLIVVLDMIQPNGGYQISIQNINVGPDNITVEAIRTVPGPNCMTAAVITQPWATQVVSKSSLDLQLQLQDVTDSCL